MKIQTFLCVLWVGGIISGCCTTSTNSSKQASVKDEYYVAAYFWPACHDDPKAREFIWTEGIGEWEVIQKGNPRYEGHYQPKLPLWGYEMDNDPKVMERWIDVATYHGINTFIFDWYWYDGGPFLEGALNDGFLKAKNNEKMYFYLMWANHSVVKSWWNYHLYGADDNSILWGGAVDMENFKIIVERVIRQYFHKPNYLKIDGKPVFSIFDLWELMQSFGGEVKETREALNFFYEEARKAGFPGIHFQLNPGSGSKFSAKFVQDVESIGFNSVMFYNMGGSFLGPWPDALVEEDYLVYGQKALDIREHCDKALNIPFFPTTSCGWDHTPRFPRLGLKNTVHYSRTPETFATLLSKAKQYIDAHPDQPKLMAINAWNEWVEDGYLLPDMKYGFSYLEAVKNVMDGKYDSFLIR